MKKYKKIVTSVMALAMAVSMVFTGCAKKENKDQAAQEDTNKNDSKTGITDGSKNSSKLIVTIGDSKIYLDEMMYYVFMQEKYMEQYEQMYQSFGGDIAQYWDEEYSEGITNRQYIKNSTMDMVTMYEILNLEGKKQNLTLTEEEKKNKDSSVEQFMNAVTKDQLKITGLTEEKVGEIMEKLMIASQFMDKTITGFDIDDEAIKAQFKKEDYKQYDTDSLYISKKSVDESGNAIDLDSKQKAEAKKKIESLLAKAKKSDDFTKLTEENQDVKQRTDSFIKKDEETSSVSKDFKEAAMKLKKGEVSNVLELEDGYYIIRLKDDTSTSSYDTACNNAIQAEEQKRFNEYYEELKKTYTITVEEKNWDSIVMGETTLIKEDIENTQGQEENSENTENTQDK